MSVVMVYGRLPLVLVFGRVGGPLETGLMNLVIFLGGLGASTHPTRRAATNAMSDP